MESREFQRLFRRAVKLYERTTDGKDHGFNAIMDELVMECDDEQWRRVADAFDLEHPSQALQEMGNID